MRRGTKGIVWLVVAACAAGGAGLGWKHLRPQSPPPAGPLTAEVARRTLSTSVLATGAVKAQVGAEVRVGCRISGRVEKLHANIGDLVKRGQVIAELEKADLQAQVQQRTAELDLARAKLSAVQALRPREIEKAQAEVDQCRATAALNQMELARQEELLRQDFTSQQARDRAREQLDVSQSRLTAARKSLELATAGYDEDLRQARAEVERAAAVLADAQVQLSYATITAPIAGVIASVSTQEGETVAAGLSAPTFVTIIDLGRLQVDTFVDEVDIGKIAPGQKVTFTVDSFPAREFGGQVAAIYPKAVIQENVVTYDVVVKITDDYQGLLRPEMTASVTVQLEARQNVLAIPARAIKRLRGKTVAYVLPPGGGEAQPREIKAGWRDTQYVEVVAGLTEGDTVLLELPAQTGEPR